MIVCLDHDSRGEQEIHNKEFHNLSWKIFYSCQVRQRSGGEVECVLSSPGVSQQISICHYLLYTHKHKYMKTAYIYTLSMSNIYIF
jgi:hypothetical protein